MRSGLLLIDKPTGITSHDVVHRVRKILGTSQVGHAGTLDPLASGLLVLLIGEGTKLSDYLRGGDKGYEVKVQLGVKTDTLDADGEVLSQQDVDLDPEWILVKARECMGTLNLPVPVFSAVKRQGKKLYELARQQKEVVAPHREMEFFDFQSLEVGKDSLRARLGCSKGSYIRAWAAHLGELLECGGIVAELRRVYSFPYKLEKAWTLEQLAMAQEAGEDLADSSAFIPLSDCLPGWKALTVGGRDETLMSHGQIPNQLSRRLIFEQKEANRGSRVVGIKILSGETGELLSLLEAQPFKGLKIRRIFRPHQRA